MEIGSQRDGLVNIGFDHLHYKGLGRSIFAQADGLWELGTEKFTQVRLGVLLQIANHGIRLLDDMLIENLAADEA